MKPPTNANPTSVHISLDKYLQGAPKVEPAKLEERANRQDYTSLASIRKCHEVKTGLPLCSETKRSLLAILCKYILSGEAPLNFPTVINDVDQTWMIDPTVNVVRKLFSCNHEEADTRMVYHASLLSTPVVISANDSDVFMFDDTRDGILTIRAILIWI